MVKTTTGPRIVKVYTPTNKMKRKIHLQPNDSWECICTKVHELGSYVAAHWTYALDMKCDQCGRHYSLKNGLLEAWDH